jgi:hypothetical protein
MNPRRIRKLGMLLGDCRWFNIVFLPTSVSSVAAEGVRDSRWLSQGVATWSGEGKTCCSFEDSGMEHNLLRSFRRPCSEMWRIQHDNNWLLFEYWSRKTRQNKKWNIPETLNIQHKLNLTHRVHWLLFINSKTQRQCAWVHSKQFFCSLFLDSCLPMLPRFAPLPAPAPQPLQSRSIVLGTLMAQSRPKFRRLEAQGGLPMRPGFALRPALALQPPRPIHCGGSLQIHYTWCSTKNTWGKW